MPRKHTRRGGAWYDPRTWLAKSPEQAEKDRVAAAAKKAEECAAAKTKTADAKKAEDEVCAGESSAADVPSSTPVTDTAPAALGGRHRRRRHATRRKTKGGKRRAH